MDLTFRYDNETDDVELVLGDKVVDTIGQDVVRSWVTAYNKKHGYVERVEQTPETTEQSTEAEVTEADEDKEVDTTEGE